MRWDELDTDNCPVARTMAVMGDRWTVLILRDCLRGVSRFDDFCARLGCSRTTVSDRLARLVEAGVLETEAYQAHPPRHDYRLTAQGRDLGGVLMLMARWGETWRPKAGTRPLQRRHRACGRAFQPILVCSECGEPVAPGSVEYGDTAAAAG
ncbi:MAG: helix-turn-helix transcriptional regulator [Phenylobacterium sp.]|uniref:winged helix-turn-helix transcriptional regulator n=1 Tax=Phenylobacterium sp. TaxID=1871053 RepID=UPI001A626884|nr:helix-turn-helix domain-containing protein [Phenylobacterium sp.]MBL8774258.1 helix-turn-helix transcriptional regulator [Phenylobacterium sp.]